jgi:NADP-dependent 3-hydroxy acid dehydrogenase YdfG
MSNPLELRGRTVIVTGASSGIGEATARALHAAGARPVLAARRTERLNAQLGGALYMQTDVTDAGRVAHLVAATLKRHGRIDALVNNAGASLHDTTIEQLDLGDFHQVLDLNLAASSASCRPCCSPE